MPETETKLTFEQALADLDQVVRELEDGQVGLEQSLACYEKGIGLLKHCYGLLQKVEQRIVVLTGVDENGQPMTQAFDSQGVDEPRSASKSVPAPRRAVKKAVEAETEPSELF